MKITIPVEFEVVANDGCPEPSSYDAGLAAFAAVERMKELRIRVYEVPGHPYVEVWLRNEPEKPPVEFFGALPDSPSPPEPEDHSPQQGESTP